LCKIKEEERLCDGGLDRIVFTWILEVEVRGWWGDYSGIGIDPPVSLWNVLKDGKSLTG
jgi:hypothetical protein